MRGKSEKNQISSAVVGTATPSAVAQIPATGLAGVFERILRQFKTGVHFLALVPIYALGCGCIALAGAPVLWALDAAWHGIASWSPVPRYLAISAAGAAGFFVFGLSLMFVAAVTSRLLVGRLKAWRGSYHSAYILRWYVHNALIYLVRYTFLEYVTPTPLNVLFYRLMGMKIGDDTQINTTHISDASIIEIGHRVTLGGSATIVGHYGMGGYLVIAPVKIGDGATIGLKATIMGGVEIGEKAKVMPNSVVLPRTKIPAGETWGGVPAQKLEFKKKKAA